MAPRAVAGRRHLRPCRSKSSSRGPTPWWTPFSPPVRSRRCNRSSFGPDIEGRIAEILVREGSEVARGAPLFKVDDAELKAEVARAEAERDLAQQSLTRTRDLLGQKASSQSELERAEATSRSTAAQLELLKVRLDRTVVRAPFAGVVGRTHREPGGLRHDRLPARHAPDRVAAAGRVSGPGALRRSAQGRTGGDLPGGGAPRQGVHRSGGLRGSDRPAPRANHHGQGAGAEPAA